MLEREFGELRICNFDVVAFDEILTRVMMHGTKIYSGAYIMPSRGKHSGAKKHWHHLTLLNAMLTDRVPARLQDIDSMRKAFDLLRSYPMMGNFLAYQYVTDLNYSTLMSFSESEFVSAGPGARDGRKNVIEGHRMTLYHASTSDSGV